MAFVRTSSPVIDVIPTADLPDSMMAFNSAICERPGGRILMVHKAVDR